MTGGELIAIAATHARRPVESVAALGEAMLAQEGCGSGAPVPSGGRRGSASLNPDAIPIELAITANGGGLKLRLVVDPAAECPDPAERYRRGRAGLREALAINGTGSMGDPLERLLGAMIPDDAMRLRAYRSGPFCMAAGVGEPGAAIYIDALTHEADAFARAGRWLAESLPDPREALDALATMRPVARLAAIGMEGSSPDRALAKLYWRLHSPVALSSLGLGTFRHPDFARFVTLAMGGKSVPASGLMLAAGFRLDDGTLHDAKLNLCGHCLAWGRERWPAVIDDCTRAFGLAAIPAREVLARPHHDVSFLTFGLTRRGDRRINCYLRPTARH